MGEIKITSATLRVVGREGFVSVKAGGHRFGMKGPDEEGRRCLGEFISLQ